MLVSNLVVAIQSFTSLKSRDNNNFVERSLGGSCAQGNIMTRHNNKFLFNLAYIVIIFWKTNFLVVCNGKISATYHICHI